MARVASFPRELTPAKPHGYSLSNLAVMTACAVGLSTPQENLMAWRRLEADPLVGEMRRNIPIRGALLSKTDFKKWSGKKEVGFQ